jgi:hypothetical protein|tara:strand:+ start:2229 stop:4793 length:2565 start_codon:yes stop_codon:yes gene_type:complete
MTLTDKSLNAVEQTSNVDSNDHQHRGKHSFLASDGKAIIDQGYRIVPISRGYKFPNGLKNWQMIEADHKLVDEWANNQFINGGVGILTGEVVGIDIDVLDHAIVDKLIIWCEANIGYAPRRVGFAPKALLVYRTETPFKKLKSRVYQDNDGRDVAVEILAQGQQFVAKAVHPVTNKPYEWQNYDLVSTPKESLSLISQDQCSSLIEYFHAIAPKNWKQKSYTLLPALSDDKTDISLINIKPKADLSNAEIKEVLNRVDNEDYHVWVKVGMALHHQYDGSSLGFELWDEWSRTSSNYDAKALPAKWETFEADSGTNPTTFATVLMMAKVVYDNTQEALHDCVTRAIANGDLNAANIPDWIVRSANTRGLQSTGQDILISLVMTSLNVTGIKGSIKKDIKNIMAVNHSASLNNVNKSTIPVQYDHHKTLNCDVFPDVIFSGERLIKQATLGNLRAVINGYGLIVSYDVISKEQKIILPKGSHQFSLDMEDNAALLYVKSLCELNQLPPRIIELITTVIAENEVNPVIDYISALKWDGISRIATLAASVNVKRDYDDLWNKFALRRWLIQCVASADHAKHSGCARALAKFEYCLILIGEQGIAKTSFFKHLIPYGLTKYFADGVLLQPDNKDSVMHVISHWIVELGEIEATTRKADQSQLKAFLSKAKDTMRLPYAKAQSNMRRRTSLCASANDVHFMPDRSGSRRYWPIHVDSINILPNSEFDIDQLWAEVWSEYTNGAIWWDEDGMRELVDAAGKQHAAENSVRDALEHHFIFNIDLEMSKNILEKECGSEFFSRKAIAAEIDMPFTYLMPREITAAMKEFGVNESTINGVRGFRLVKRSCPELDNAYRRFYVVN